MSKVISFSKYFCLTILAAGFLTISCSKDKDGQIIPSTDDSTSVDDTASGTPPSPPSAFEVMISCVGLNSALATWTASTSESEGEILYNVLVDGEEVASGISELYYFIGDLLEDSAHEVQITAFDHVGETSKFADFTTQTFGTGELRLAHMTVDFEDFEYHEICFIYNEEGQLIRQNILTPNFREIVDVLYSYNDDGKESQISEKSVWYDYGPDDITYQYRRLTYTYHETSEAIKNVIYGSYGHDDIYDQFYHSPTSDFFFLYQYWNIEPPFPSWAGDMIRDDSDRLISVSAIHDTNGSSWEQTLEYTGNNMTKVTNGITGDVFEVLYDSQPNFHMIPNTKYHVWLESHLMLLNRQGFIAIPNEFYEEIEESTLSFKHENDNNPTAYLKNGEVLRSLDYEYYPFGYPKRIVVDGDESKVIKIYYMMD